MSPRLPSPIAPGTRWLRLGDAPIELVAAAPRPGDALTAEFVLAAGRNTLTPLTTARLRDGEVVVSTLPNISRHACAVQILDLEERLHHRLRGLCLIHVSADPVASWAEVDVYHRDLTAEGYSLDGATAEHAAAFASAFGVAVRGHRRIAHGLFALRDGHFVVVEIPVQQLGVPDIAGFVESTATALRGG